jgi:hypothetical protein
VIKNILLGSILLVSLVGCGGSTSTSSPTPGGAMKATPGMSGSPMHPATPPAH